MAKIQWKLNSQPCRVFAAKVMALSEKECDPENWNRNIWEDPGEDAHIKSLNSEESSLPVLLILALM